MDEITEIKKFLFKPEKEAAGWVENQFAVCLAKSPFLQELDKQLRERTSSKLFDWIDCIGVSTADTIQELGFRKDAGGIFRHPRAQLPGIQITKSPSVAVAVDSIADFLMVRSITGSIDGDLLGGFRSALTAEENGVQVYVVERRCYPKVSCTPEKVLRAYELWKTRIRAGDEIKAFQDAFSRLDIIVELIGKPMGATVILDVERQYWQTKNRAGQVQKARQDGLGMGWANHDHHTFRSSRRYFLETIQLFEKLGFQCRERFYAGLEAGWGAQVMEHPDIRLVLFIDVDLSAEELVTDFAHTRLEEQDHLGTIGLWCGLHGESILEAGMHHLEAQFVFDKLRQDLATEDVTMMEPFSNFSYLKQAFTVGERWKVQPERVATLLERGLISENQAKQFLKEGAIGSHLENLERHDGFKGFNQKAVSAIIHRTDPRLNLGA